MSKYEFKSRKIIVLGEPVTPPFVKWAVKNKIVKHERTAGVIMIGATIVSFILGGIFLAGIVQI